jgi:ADP-heptose:LPS heptosyltransferase
MTASILVICPRSPARLMLALSALAALRSHHKDQRIIALVAPATQAIARALPTFDDVWLDPRASFWDVRNMMDLRADLRSTTFLRVYDFEQSSTSQLYFHLMFGWPVNDQRRQTILWSGDVRGVGLFHAQTQTTSAHVMDQWKDQLRSAGVLECLPPDVSWAARQVRDFSAPFKMDQPFAMVCLDSEADDAWPADRFAALAEWLAARKLTPLLVGFDEHSALAERIGQRCPDAIDITGKAPIIDTVFLSWAAAAAIGAHSALMHLAVIANCRSVVLCGAGVDPAVEGARGSRVKILKRGRLAEITTPEILTLLGDLSA